MTPLHGSQPIRDSVVLLPGDRHVGRSAGPRRWCRTVDAVDLCFAGAAAQARPIPAGEVSARELVSAMLDRIEKVDPRLNCYRVVLADQALEAAAKVDASNDDAPHLPLRGVPVAVKDSVDVAGQITTWGTSANVEQAESDAPIVSALRGAGAIIIGKTNLSELAAWPFTETSTWGATRTRGTPTTAQAGRAEDRPPRSLPGCAAWPSAQTAWARFELRPVSPVCSA